MLQAELKILCALADGPKTYYDMAIKQPIGSSGSVVRSLNKFKAKKIVYIEEASRNRKIYHLTPKGKNIVQCATMILKQLGEG